MSEPSTGPDDGCGKNFVFTGTGEGPAAAGSGRGVWRRRLSTRGGAVADERMRRSTPTPGESRALTPQKDGERKGKGKGKGTPLYQELKGLMDQIDGTPVDEDRDDDDGVRDGDGEGALDSLKANVDEKPVSRWNGDGVTRHGKNPMAAMNAIGDQGVEMGQGRDENPNRPDTAGDMPPNMATLEHSMNARLVGNRSSQTPWMTKSMLKLVLALPPELLPWQLRTDPQDKNMVEDPEMVIAFWDHFKSASRGLKEGEQVEITLPAGTGRGKKRMKLAKIDGLLELRFCGDGASVEQNTAVGSLMDGVEKEKGKKKKKKCKSKSKRPAPQKMESESVVNLGRKVEDLHLGQQVKTAPTPDTAKLLEGGDQISIQQAHGSASREELASTVAQEQFNSNVDSMMTKICEITIEAIKITGKTTKNEAEWTCEIVRGLQQWVPALSDVFIPYIERSGVGGNEWTHTINAFLEVGKLCNLWHESLQPDDSGVIALDALDVQRFLEHLVVKNVELVKEWLWCRVMRNGGVAMDTSASVQAEEEVSHTSKVKREEQELEELESNESMEYISPISIVEKGKSSQNSKTPVEKESAGRCINEGSDATSTMGNLFPAPLKRKNFDQLNAGLETAPAVKSATQLNTRLINIEKLLQNTLDSHQPLTNSSTALSELKTMIQDIKDVIYGQFDGNSEGNGERVYAKDKGLLFLCKLAEGWTEDCKYSPKRVERTVIGDEQGENKGLVELCYSLSEELVARAATLLDEKQELQKEVERLRILLGSSKGDELQNDPVGSGIEIAGRRREVCDEEMAKLKMRNEALEMKLLDSRMRRIELVDAMVELDRGSEEKDSALMEVLWPQGEANERKTVRKGRYRRDETLGEEKTLATSLGTENGWCGIM